VPNKHFDFPNPPSRQWASAQALLVAVGKRHDRAIDFMRPVLKLWKARNELFFPKLFLNPPSRAAKLLRFKVLYRCLTLCVSHVGFSPLVVAHAASFRVLAP
jgi:hypothetical protein